MTLHTSVQSRLSDTENRAKPGKYAPVNLTQGKTYDFVE